jgi:hypothetical protein
MAIVNIQYSQATIDQLNKLSLDSTTQGTLSSLIDSYILTGTAINSTYTAYTSYNFSGNTLTLNFADGASKVYTGVSGFNPNLGQGQASATGYQFIKSGFASISETGTLAINYASSVVNGIAYFGFSVVEDALNSAAINTFSPSANPSYNPDLGNLSSGFNGSVKTNSNGDLIGSISHITQSADKFLKVLTIDGSFNVAGNVGSVINGTESTTLSGVLANYLASYADGSFENITDAQVGIDQSQNFDLNLFGDGSKFTGSDVVSVSLPHSLYSDYLVSTGAGNDQIVVDGGGGRLNVDAGAGIDTIRTTAGSHKIDGGSGLDTLIVSGNFSSFSIGHSGGGFIERNLSNTESNQLSNIERVQFNDFNVALDISGTGGEGFRIYQAAFNRKPDLEGLGYWINDLDHGSTLTNVAGGFFQSPEFIALYGSSSPTDNVLITRLYQNVLHREPDQAGFDYWANQLRTGQITQAGTLASFSESAENQAQVLGSIQDGIKYLAFHG